MALEWLSIAILRFQGGGQLVSQMGSYNDGVILTLIHAPVGT